ncbi:DUF192 domain-containing protein [Kaistia adipata]|uniref:DUF192 domain-containing protein n=1 Tax=Kaistia adipata TaxID=166954 RepID=UPI0003FB6929|nr:DUF192 domain-containing protein [Kaistia adipata]
MTAPSRLRGSLWFGLLSIAWLVLATGVAVRAADRPTVSVATRSGTHTLTIEWARTPSERAQGLMGRERMADGHGMLFDFGSEQPVYFWMKDTPLSLDMIFIKADGRTTRIAHGTTPFSEDVIPGGEPVRYVLELVAGGAKRIGLRPGDRFRIPPP